MKKILFLLIKSPFESDRTGEMLRLKGSRQAGVLLFQDAVLYAHQKDFRSGLEDNGITPYATGEDLKARGLPEPEGVEIIDHARAIDLIMEGYDQVVSL